MNVAQLIEILKTMPQDAKVILAANSVGRWDSEVRDVIYNDPVKVNRFNDPHTVELDNWPPEREMARYNPFKL